MKATNTFEATVSRSQSRYGHLSLRIYDKAKGRLAATPVNAALFGTLEDLGVEAGDKVLVTITYEVQP